MVGQPNAENKRRLVLMEHMLADIEDIVEDFGKEVDGLVDFCLNNEESQ